MFSKDLWLSQHIGKSCFVGRWSEGSVLKDEITEKGLYTVKIPFEDKKAFASLLRYGFDLVALDVQMEARHLVIDHRAPAYMTRWAQERDKIQVCTIAQDVFQFDRFHGDENLPKSHADQVKKAWVANYFSGQRGTHMVVAHNEAEVVGFLQIIMTDDDVLVIDLIGVSPHAQGAGVAKAMIHYAHDMLKPEKLRVGSQLENILALNLYSSMGFRVQKASYALHYHYEGIEE